MHAQTEDMPLARVFTGHWENAASALATSTAFPVRNCNEMLMDANEMANCGFGAAMRKLPLWALLFIVYHANSFWEFLTGTEEGGKKSHIKTLKIK